MRFYSGHIGGKDHPGQVLAKLGHSGRPAAAFFLNGQQLFAKRAGEQLYILFASCNFCTTAYHDPASLK
jgi:hypothetical protein